MASRVAQAVTDLREATALVAEGLSGTGHPERVQDAYELIGANEAMIALENLCSNPLYGRT